MANNKAAEILNDEVYVLTAGTPVYLGVYDVCRMTGKSKQWINRLTNEGTLEKFKTKKGPKYEMHEVVKAYLAMIEAREQDRSDADGEADAVKKRADADYKKAKATIAQLDAKEREGKMHRSEDVAALTEDLIFTIRAALLALPGRLAVDVLDATDRAQATDIIRREVYQIMEELSNYEYDPAKYEERVRERLNLEALDGDDED